MSEAVPWIVRGAKADSGKEVTARVRAATRADAEKAAQREGILVSSVEPEAISYATPDPEERPDYTHPGFAFGFGFFAFFGAFTAYLIVAIVVAAILFWAGVLKFG